MDKDEVEASVQEYLDSAIGKDKVRFELCTIGNMTAMSFHRGFDYSLYHADPAKDMMDADAFMMTRFRLSLPDKPDRFSGCIP